MNEIDLRIKNQYYKQLPWHFVYRTNIVDCIKQKNFCEEKISYVISLKSSINNGMSVWVWKCICHENTHISMLNYRYHVSCIKTSSALCNIIIHLRFYLRVNEKLYGTQLVWLNWMSPFYNRLCLAWMSLDFGVNDVVHNPKLDRVW